MGHIYANPQDDASPWLARHRTRFLQLAGQQVPALLEDLRQLLPLVTDPAERRKGVPFLRGYDPAEWIPRRRPVSAELNHALLHWGEQHRLTPLWVLQAALDTLEGWADGSLHAHAFAAVPERVTGEPVFPAWTAERGWDPATESKADARSRLRKEAIQWIDGYLHIVEEHALGRLSLDVPDDREPDTLEPAIELLPPISDRHLRWLASYQVGNRSMDALRKTRSRTYALSTISEALHNASEAIGIPLRARGRSGRRKRPAN